MSPLGFAKRDRLIDVGPAGFHPPSAMELGVTHPDSGLGLFYGHHAPADDVIAEAARQLYTRKNPTIFPGPLYCWAWNSEWIAKSQALLRLAGARIRANHGIERVNPTAA